MKMPYFDSITLLKAGDTAVVSTRRGVEETTVYKVVRKYIYTSNNGGLTTRKFNLSTGAIADGQGVRLHTRQWMTLFRRRELASRTLAAILSPNRVVDAAENSLHNEVLDDLIKAVPVTYRDETSHRGISQAVSAARNDDPRTRQGVTLVQYQGVRSYAGVVVSPSSDTPAVSGICRADHTEGKLNELCGSVDTHGVFLLRADGDDVLVGWYPEN